MSLNDQDLPPRPIPQVSSLPWFYFSSAFVLIVLLPEILQEVSLDLACGALTDFGLLAVYSFCVVHPLAFGLTIGLLFLVLVAYEVYRVRNPSEERFGVSMKYGVIEPVGESEIDDFVTEFVSKGLDDVSNNSAGLVHRSDMESGPVSDFFSADEYNADAGLGENNPSQLDFFSVWGMRKYQSAKSPPQGAGVTGSMRAGGYIISNKGGGIGTYASTGGSDRAVQSNKNRWLSGKEKSSKKSSHREFEVEDIAGNPGDSACSSKSDDSVDSPMTSLPVRVKPAPDPVQIGSLSARHTARSAPSRPHMDLDDVAFDPEADLQQVSNDIAADVSPHRHVLKQASMDAYDIDEEDNSGENVQLFSRGESVAGSISGSLVPKHFTNGSSAVGSFNSLSGKSDSSESRGPLNANGNLNGGGGGGGKARRSGEKTQKLKMQEEALEEIQQQCRDSPTSEIDI
jgi:hypothetical protein